MTRRGLLVVGLLLALSTLVSPARAATRSVHLTASGPTPAHLTIAPGDKVVFVNDDTVPHQVSSQGAWQFDSGPLPPGQTSSATPALTAPGSYAYDDVRGIVVLPQTFHGTLVVPQPTPKPTPTPRPTATRAPSPRATPAPTRTPAPPASPAASVTPSPSASPPQPSATPSPVASVVPAGSPTASPAPDVRYGGPAALVQGSPHRYGLPALIGLVGIGGVASLIGRYLLALPQGRR